MHFIEKYNRENIDGHHLRPPGLAILLETIERENFDELLRSLAPNPSIFTLSRIVLYVYGTANFEKI